MPVWMARDKRPSGLLMVCAAADEAAAERIRIRDVFIMVFNPFCSDSDLANDDGDARFSGLKGHGRCLNPSFRAVVCHEPDYRHDKVLYNVLMPI